MSPELSDEALAKHLFPKATRFSVNKSINIESRGENVWAICSIFGQCLNKQMEWEYEPLPSSRTEDFIDRTRFYSLKTTYLFFEEFARQRGLTKKTLEE